MKLLKKTKLVLLALCLVCVAQSCGSSSESIKDEQLSGFMLGGIYFINGYGGVSNVETMMSDAGYTSKEEIVNGYKEIFEFPFDSSQASGVKSMFSNMWEITGKATLLETIEDLKTRESKFKSWDYARIVNNACMGYAAGWLTKEEVLKINSEVLPLARKDYKNWNDYFIDFEKGRVDWNADDPESGLFKELSTTITKGENSIYNILPLNNTSTQE